MSSFTEPLTVTKISGRLWRTSRSFQYYLDEPGGVYVEIPEGYATDFATVPRIFWTLFPPDGAYTQAAVLHDYLYENQIFLKAKCDKIFLQAMKVLGVPFLTRWTMYFCVAAFGAAAYKKWSKK